MKIPKIEYEIFYLSYDNKNYTKLKLDLCKGTKIEISIPVKINESLDKYNPKSGYYNDICYKTTSKTGTDISLKDRRNEFIENNMALCEENCEFIDYNYNIEKVKCSCEIKTNISPNYDFRFNKKEFLKSFTDIKNIANIDIIKCYKIVLNINNLIHNFGFCIMVSIIILFLMTILLFIFISYSKIKKDLFIIFKILNDIIPIELKKCMVQKKESKIEKKSNKKRKIIKRKNNFKNFNIKDKNHLINRNNKIKYKNNVKQRTKYVQDKSYI